eukprot:6831290-Alexandrium_andersonii.AAC.1
MSVFGSPGYRAVTSENWSRRRAAALMGPAESARSSANASSQASRSGSWTSAAGGSWSNFVHTHGLTVLRGKLGFAGAGKTRP